MANQRAVTTIPSVGNGFSQPPFSAESGTSAESTPNNKINATLPAPPQKDFPMVTDTQTTPENTVIEKARVFLLRFSSSARPHRLPSHTEVVISAWKHFQQEGMKCIPIFGRGPEVCYKFQLREEVLKHGQALTFQNCVVPLSVWEKKSTATRKQGTLLTFKGAAEDEMELLPNEAFDRSIEELQLQLIFSTRFQYWKIEGVRVQNGNRYCLVETPDNINVIPESMPVIDPATTTTHQVRITFRGQSRYCSRCDQMHTTRCPEAEARREKYEQREALKGEIKTKLYSDSTLRRVDILGLRAEVLCMSGGGLGQVVQSAIDDPDEYDNVVIFGGTNDKKLQNFPDTDAYAKNIDMALIKLGKHARDNPHKKFLLVHQDPQVPEDTVRTDAVIRDLYLGRRMNSLAEKNPNITTTNIAYEADETGHPTEKGTEEILLALNTLKFSPTQLVRQMDCIVSDRLYSNVQSVYRYGCGGCDRFGVDVKNEVHSNQLICDDCLSQPATLKPEELLRKLAKRLDKSANGRASRDDDHAASKRVKIGEEDTQ